MNQFSQSIILFDFTPKDCFIDYGLLRLQSLDFAKKDLKAPDLREDIFPEKDDDNFIEYLGVINSINFCFTDFKTGKKFDAEYPKGKIHNGFYALTACFKRALDNKIPILNPHFLERIGIKEVEDIFHYAATPMPMLEERLKNLRDVGKILRTSGLESFSNIFKLADFRSFNNGKGVAEVLAGAFDCYYDANLWIEKGNPPYVLKFYKRAQLMPLDYYDRAKSSGGVLRQLKDIESIGPIADNEVPRALRSLGIIYYNQDLEEDIDSGALIHLGSRAEMEIRIQTIKAVTCMLWLVNNYRINSLGKAPITIAELDYALWLAGREDRQPSHYTYTTAY